MVVISPVRGLRGDIAHPFSRTGAYAPSNALIQSMRASTGDRITVRRLRGAGLGSIDVPEWSWWAAGGVLAGAVAGFVLFNKKR